MLETLVLCSALFWTALSKWTFTPVSDPRSSYSEEFARRAVLLSYSAYQPYHLLDTWDCSYCKDLPEFQLNDIHISDDGVLLAYSGYDPVYDQIVFAFRGTVNTDNWVTNADFLQVNYPGVVGGKVHRGFYNAWNDFKEYILPCVDKLTKAHPSASLFVTGHSLGAALAQVATLDLIKEAKAVGFYGAHSVMTFGSPRWCNEALADYFESVVAVNFRLVNKHDKIPPLPPIFFNYHHTATEVWYTSLEPMEYTLCNGNDGEDPGCVYKLVDPTWEDHCTYLGIRLNSC